VWAEFQQITDPAALAAAGPDAVADAAAHNAFLTAESAAAEYRHEALVMLGRSEQAQAEARKACASESAKPWHQALPDSDDALRAATEAATKAQTRTAEHLLAARLEQLHTQARPEPVRPAPWSQRLPVQHVGDGGARGVRVAARAAMAMAALIERGVGVQAKLSSLVPIGTSVYSSAVCVFESPHGSGSHRVDTVMSPVHVVGERYPLVFDPRNTKRVRLGPMAAARRQHKTRLGFKRSAQRSALLSGAVCVLAMVGLIAGV
jgi:hypothetical protein